MNNISWTKHILEICQKAGVQEICLCAGSRNAPFVKNLYEGKTFQIYNFFEERAASFFALGRIQSQKKPVAVITTSGTATANLLPAAMEAFYSQLPLLLITADRPKSYRKTGAPQSIEQKNMFMPYTLKNYDLEEPQSFELPPFISSPIHINVCIEEPLLSENASIDFQIVSENCLEKTNLISQNQQELRKLKKPLILLGDIPSEEREPLKSFLLKVKAPIYAEASSGLQQDSDIQDLLIQSGPPFLKTLLKNKVVESVLRFGGIPSCDFWRQLEKENTPILNVSHKPFSGLSFLKERPIDFKSFWNFSPDFKGQFPNEFQEKDLLLRNKISQLLLEEPLSEAGLIFKLSENVKEDHIVFLGNSLPIREWNAFATSKTKNIFTCRGVNGIDGLVSLSLGLSEPQKTTWSILGDLSTLYDLSGLWPLKHFPSFAQRDFKLVVVNNKGGKIFSQMYGDPHFENPHNLNFKSWAEFWKVEHQFWKGEKLLNPSLEPMVLELLPETQSTERFLKKYNDLEWF